LIACSNQAVVNKLTSEYGNDLSRYEDIRSFGSIPIDQESDGVESDDDSAGKYYVVVNGFKDSVYTVETVQWETLLSGSVNLTDNSNSISVTGSMKIREARGFLFLNTLDRIADEFRTEPTGIVFLLKTFFVGHTANTAQGTPESPTIIADLKPLQFLLLDVKGSFSPEGGIYNLDFVSLTNGATRLPQVARAAQNVKFTPRTLILKDVMNAFKDALNNKSSQTFRDVREAARRRVEADPTNNVNVDELFRKISFDIVLAEPYQSDDYLVNLYNPRLRNDSGEAAAFDFGRQYTVDQALQEILQRCQKIQDDLLKPDAIGNRYRYKIHSEMTMVDKSTEQPGSDTATGDNDGVLFRYTIKRSLETTNEELLEFINRDLTQESTEEPIETSVEGVGDLRNSIIEFDYFFTGRSIDIVKFDINMQQGLAFLQILRTTNNSPGAAEDQVAGGSANTELAVTGVTQRPASELSRRARTPIFPSTDVQNPLVRNIGNPLSTMAFNAALARFAAYEQIETNFTIRGNPYLLAVTNTPISDKTDEGNDQPPDERRVLLNWDRTPAIAKVNIKMPIDNNSPSAALINQGDQARLIDFWYTGFYNIVKIVHRFEGGLFTQDIGAIATPSDDLFQQSGENSSREVAAQPQVVDASTTTAETEALSGETASAESSTPRASNQPRTALDMRTKTKAVVPRPADRERQAPPQEEQE
jgi:hypothetical protein